MFLAPLIALIIMYGKIIHKLWKGSSKDLGEQNQRLHQRRRDNKRIITILITVTILFFILVSPSYIFYLVFNHGGVMSHLDSIESWMRWQIYVDIPITLHTTINPIVYSVVDHKFRASLLNLICRKKGSANERKMSPQHQRDQKYTTESTNFDC